jgi:hypothetical protein
MQALSHTNGGTSFFSEYIKIKKISVWDGFAVGGSACLFVLFRVICGVSCSVFCEWYWED